MSIARISWNGWPECLQIQNGIIEAVIVPCIGRVMQLRLLDDPVGAFWRNPALDGQIHDDFASPREWCNFGGDKCWPAPQSGWANVQGHDWPPPDAFDSRPMNANATESSVVLTSQIDSSFGIQVLRHVELDPVRPVMRIRSEFLKLAGEPIEVSVWTITQLRDPECISIELSPQSKFHERLDADDERPTCWPEGRRKRPVSRSASQRICEDWHGWSQHGLGGKGLCRSH